MNRLVGLGMTACLGLGGVLALTLLFGQSHSSAAVQDESGSRPVFTPQTADELTDANLVDTLNNTPFTLPLSRVEWKNGTLSLDFKVLTADTSANDIYRCMAEASVMSFENSSNVKRIMLRLVAEDQWMGTRHLLLAADMVRDEYSAPLSSVLKDWGETRLPEALQQQFHITHTKLWLNHYETR